MDMVSNDAPKKYPWLLAITAVVMVTTCIRIEVAWYKLRVADSSYAQEKRIPKLVFLPPSVEFLAGSLGLKESDLTEEQREKMEADLVRIRAQNRLVDVRRDFGLLQFPLVLFAAFFWCRSKGPSKYRWAHDLFLLACVVAFLISRHRGHIFFGD